MKQIKISQVQKIVNLCHTKKDFTFELNKNYAPYIVSIKNIYKGKNPSLDFELNLKIKDTINKSNIISKYYDSIGGWKDEDDNFCIDANVHFYNLTLAKDTAKAFNQKAIFDKKNNKVILINYKK
jgi:hypothetical protein